MYGTNEEPNHKQPKSKFEKKNVWKSQGNIVGRISALWKGILHLDAGKSANSKVHDCVVFDTLFKKTSGREQRFKIQRSQYYELWTMMVMRRNISIWYIGTKKKHRTTTMHLELFSWKEETWVTKKDATKNPRKDHTQWQVIITLHAIETQDHIYKTRTKHIAIKHVCCWQNSWIEILTKAIAFELLNYFKMNWRDIL